MKVDIKEILFWIFLIIAVVLLLWNVFGNSPTEMFTIIGIIFMVVLKVWNISDRQLMTEMRIKDGFKKISRDMELIKYKLKVK